ncbi:MAG: ATP-dependent sacrificial sulfur transferase LarE [Nitrospirae bacterium]|nr:ATP-dependent sacrificial sulfur transferase LarE [Nitrospirota bacterium]
MNKLDHLLKILKNMQSAVIAFSGGCDSTFLLKALKLSGIKALAVTTKSEIVPSSEIIFAKKIAGEIGIKHKIIETNEFMTNDFTKNSLDRCYICKDTRFKAISKFAKENGFCSIIEGSNKDDLKDYRPGFKAVKKYGVISPLIDAGFSKKDIRNYSKKLGLITWNKPSSACLATRIPYGYKITKKNLNRIEKSEKFLYSLGFKNIRVRDHDILARIELPSSEFKILCTSGMRKLIERKLRSYGYIFVSVDLSDFKTGSMNRLIKPYNKFRLKNE